jgi:TonB family protein
MRLLKYIATCLMLVIALAVLAQNAERKTIVRDNPEYPELARKMNLHGTVKFKLWINPDGTVRRVEYIGGHPVFAEAALSTIKKWKYEPAPRESTEMVEIKL